MSLIKQVLTVELLYDDLITPDPRELTLSEIAYEMTEGCVSGMVSVGRRTKLSKKKMAAALRKQGSDPSFLIPEEDK